ncbi:zinc-ribbon domain-containing protein [Anaeromyxobacter oryzae]|uniref:Uncharacterized protein n=1 Tax=Anaeromyxobacter oryzae TaxID=2918170 RepID=A0ABN6MU82_9BACT|nr:zinc-ribbon domain-containing protein [Anaeromyxobacter oryzae]BDG04505.1 hypothetical protein AMOR_35010 [Anaeromyxobacter oryzae]
MQRKLPASVATAVAALLLVTAIQVAAVVALGLQQQVGRPQALFSAALVVLLVTGLVRRWRLAWLWGRYLPIFLAIVIAGVLLWSWRSLPPLKLALGLLLFAVPLGVAGVALGRPTAFEWFRLVCPECGARSGRGDLLLRNVRCPRCGDVF